MATSEYWINREHENIQALKQREKNYLLEIEVKYRKAIEEINNEIQRDIARYLETEKVGMEDFMKQADKMDVQAFNKKAAEYVRRKDFSSKANTELKLYNLKMRVNRLQLLKAKIAIRLDRLGYELEPDLQQYLRTEVMAEYERQAGILGSSVSITESQVEVLVNGTHQNANWSTRLWTNMEETRSAVNKALNSLLLQGINSRKFVTELVPLMKALEASKSKVMRLLLTESANVQVSAQLDSFQQTGFKEYEYVAEPGACAICQGLSGKIFPLQEAQAGVNRAPIHLYCRCSALPHEPEKKIKDLFDKDHWKRREANRQRHIVKAEAARTNYLEKKAYNTIKEIKDWIPGL